MSTSSPLRIVFAGTPDFSVPPLRALLDSRHAVVAVYTQPDRPAGRGRKLTASPVKQVALEAGVSVLQPDSLKPAEAQADLAALAPDVMVVVAYGLILPQAVLDIPRYCCINIHASLLPRWRGAAPIQRAIAAGDAQTGVAMMQMEAGLDTGPVLRDWSVPIGADDTGGSLHDRLSELGGAHIVETVEALAAGELQPQPQDDAGVTYAHKLSKAEALIDWHQPAADIDRQIRAFNPWPVSHTRHNGQPVRIFAAKPLAVPAGAPPGSILASESRDAILVATGDGVLGVTELQWPGKTRMPAQAVLAGRDLQGEQFT